MELSYLVNMLLCLLQINVLIIIKIDSITIYKIITMLIELYALAPHCSV